VKLTINNQTKPNKTKQTKPNKQTTITEFKRETTKLKSQTRETKDTTKEATHQHFSQKSKKS